MTPRPKFISFEGAEAVGKSTQIKLLAKRLEERGDVVKMVREPGGTDLGEAIRDLIKYAPAGRNITPEAEILLFEASRAELVKKRIQPALALGHWVLCDRFYDSTTVYQGAGRKLDAELVGYLNRFASNGLAPGLTLILDLAPEVAHKRAQIRLGSVKEPSDRMEAESADFFSRVRAGFAQLAKDEPERVRTLSAAGTTEEVAEKIWQEVAHVFSL